MHHYSTPWTVIHVYIKVINSIRSSISARSVADRIFSIRFQAMYVESESRQCIIIRIEGAIEISLRQSSRWSRYAFAWRDTFFGEILRLKAYACLYEFFSISENNLNYRLNTEEHAKMSRRNYSCNNKCRILIQIQSCQKFWLQN